MKNREGVYFIAEAGVNHNGSLSLAKELIDVAVEGNADAIKFQSFKTSSIVTKTAIKAPYQISNSGSHESQYEMLQKLELSPEMHFELLNYADKRGIDFLSTPFDLESLDFLVSELKIKCLKIPSGEITNAPFILRAAQSKLPMIISTGMASLEEIELLLGMIGFAYSPAKNDRPSQKNFLKGYKSYMKNPAAHKITLLQCATAYPAPIEDINVKAMVTLRDLFKVKTGLSDHSEGMAAALAAAALEAAVIEKHITIDRDLPGPDHRASILPGELKELIRLIRQIETALGSGIKVAAKSELPNVSIARKSIVASRPILKGEAFCESNITCKRPGTGISPLVFWDILGKKANRDYQADELIDCYETKTK